MRAGGIDVGLAIGIGSIICAWLLARALARTVFDERPPLPWGDVVSLPEEMRRARERDGGWSEQSGRAVTSDVRTHRRQSV